MEKNTVFEGGMGELGLSIEGVLRRAARSLIEQPIPAFVPEEHTRAPNGHLP